MKYNERKFPRTMNEAFGPGYANWKSDFYTKQDAGADWLWGIVAAIMAFVFFGLLLSIPA